MSKFRPSDVDTHLSQIDSNFGLVELTDIATQPHAVDSYFIWKGQFVKTTVAIAVGDTISSSNVEDTSVADLITSANTAIAGKQDKLTNPLTQSDVVNNLTSDSAVLPLSAAMGKSLNTNLQVRILDFSNVTTSALGNVPIYTLYNTGVFVCIAASIFNHSDVSKCIVATPYIYRGNGNKLVGGLHCTYEQPPETTASNVVVDGRLYLLRIGSALS